VNGIGSTGEEAEPAGMAGQRAGRVRDQVVAEIDPYTAGHATHLRTM
jgi:hypothetical protein